MPDSSGINFTSALRATDAGEQGFAYGMAILDCLRAACDGAALPSQTSITGALEVAMIRLATARRAFAYLSNSPPG